MKSARFDLWKININSKYCDNISTMTGISTGLGNKHLFRYSSFKALVLQAPLGLLDLGHLHYPVINLGKVTSSLRRYENELLPLIP